MSLLFSTFLLLPLVNLYPRCLPVRRVDSVLSSKDVLPRRPHTSSCADHSASGPQLLRGSCTQFLSGSFTQLLCECFNSNLSGEYFALGAVQRFSLFNTRWFSLMRSAEPFPDLIREALLAFIISLGEEKQTNNKNKSQ